MTIDTVIVSSYQTNCYILTKNDKVLVIDPGGNFEKIKPFLLNKDLIGTLITHNHEDHVGAVKYFEKVYDFDNLTEGRHELGPFKFEVIYTPGHTADSITYYFYDDKIMFTGDFIFKGAIGRMDLPTGNVDDMYSSLNKIKKYGDVKIYPGHGPSTSLNVEKQNNVYFSNW